MSNLLEDLGLDLMQLRRIRQSTELGECFGGESIIGLNPPVERNRRAVLWIVLREFQDYANRLNTVTDELEGTVLSVRMLPIETVRGFARPASRPTSG